MTAGVDYILGGTVFASQELEPVRADLRLADGRIAEVAEPRTLTAPAGTNVLDATDRFVLPGFVDCHDHLRNLMPGLSLGEGLTLDAFLRVMWESQRLMGPDEYRLGALLGSVQRLRAGVTTIADHCYTFHADGLDAATIAGLDASGIRWSYARGVMTRPYDPVCETFELASRRIREIVEAGTVSPARLFVAPVSIRQAAPDDFRGSVALAEELGCGLYTHVAETPAEIDAWQAEYGQSPIHALDSLGFLGERTVLVHCVRLADSEIELLAQRGSHVIHCPTNHMKLAKGFTPVPELLAAGVNVGLGIDMMADMLVEIRTEVGLHAVHRGDPAAVTKQQALQMATRGGARALGLGSGSIEPGELADLVLIDGRGLDHGPVLDPAYAVVYTAHSGMIKDVLVGGDRMVADGRSTTVDEEALMEEVENLVQHYLGRIDAGQSLWWRR